MGAKRTSKPDESGTAAARNRAARKIRAAARARQLAEARLRMHVREAGKAGYFSYDELARMSHLAKGTVVAIMREAPAREVANNG